MNMLHAAHVLAQSAGRALGAALNNVKRYGNVGYHTFTQLYSSCPVSDCASGVWAFCECTTCNTAHFRAI